MDAVTVHLTYLGVPFLTYAGEKAFYIPLGPRGTPRYTRYTRYLLQRTFATRLTERGCGEKRTGSVRFRTGIRIIDAETPNQAAFDE